MAFKTHQITHIKRLGYVPGWLEPLLLRVASDRTKVVCPVIDIINDNTFAYVRSFELHWGAFNWNLHFRWFTLGGAEVRRRKLDIAEPFP